LFVFLNKSMLNWLSRLCGHTFSAMVFNIITK
jgi:hypothetical protein